MRVPTDRLPGWVALPRPCPPARALHPLSRSIANRPEQESRSACSTRPDRPFACKHLQKTTETWLSRLNGPSRSPPASPRLGPTAASNNKHAPRIRKRDQRRARILRWASSRFVELDPDSDVDVGRGLIGHGQCCRPRCGSGAGPHCSRQQESGGHCDSHRGYGLIDRRCGARCCARPVPGASHCDRRYVPWDGHIDRRCGPSVAVAVALAPYHVREV